MLIYVASSSEYKLRMVEEVALDLFQMDLKELVVEGFNIPSGVAGYPRTADELYRGVRNRMAYLEHYYSNADYCVAQQGGAVCVGDEIFETGIVQIRNQAGTITSALRTGIPVNPVIADGLDGRLSPMDIVVKSNGQKYGGGYAGYVTDGHISAYQTYKTAVMIAFQAQRLV